MHMGGRMVGTLDAADRRSLRFTYEPGYATYAGSTPLSVSMPLRISPYSHATIHPYLWGVLPDDDRVLERWAREFGCASADVTVSCAVSAAMSPERLSTAHRAPRLRSHRRAASDGCAMTT